MTTTTGSLTKTSTRARTFILASQKGGVGKSATATNLAGALTLQTTGRVLLVDLDMQGTSSSNLGVYPRHVKVSLGHLLLHSGEKNELNIADAIFPNAASRLDVIPGGPGELNAAEYRITSEQHAQHYLNEMLEPLKEVYSYIVIDSQPNLSRINYAGLLASDGVIVITQPLLESVEASSATIGFLRKNTQAGLITTKFLGVLINDLREGETATEWGLAALESLNVPTFDTVLKHRTKIARCRGEGAPYVRLWPNDEAAGLYEDLAKEAIKRLDEMESATHE